MPALTFSGKGEMVYGMSEDVRASMCFPNFGSKVLLIFLGAGGVLGENSLKEWGEEKRGDIEEGFEELKAALTIVV